MKLCQRNDGNEAIQQVVLNGDYCVECVHEYLNEKQRNEKHKALEIADRAIMGLGAI